MDADEEGRGKGAGAAEEYQRGGFVEEFDFGGNGDVSVRGGFDDYLVVDICSVMKFDGGGVECRHNIQASGAEFDKGHFQRVFGVALLLNLLHRGGKLSFGSIFSHVFSYLRILHTLSSVRVWVWHGIGMGYKSQVEN